MSIAPMDSALLMRHVLRTPAARRPVPARIPRQTRTLALYAPQTRFLSTPTILRPSFWAAMIPRPLKERSSAPRARESNPATPFIVLALLVGSQAIQMLWLKQERAHALRKAEAKIGLLREVIERVQNGENVDVEKLLGTGDESQEREWHEVLREVKEEEALFQSKKRRKALKQEAAEQGAGKEEVVEEIKEEGLAKVESIGGVKFY
ncbi:uncharacterized protein M421DRAFT_118172 [Didymella exigua CBS 183.55]|uniref:Uncharacterized protein n=1 Tax=Didymella exigua CBS 183.55 TaxID=1150837 RepID=A0A6A5S4D3_9PLEO|nr:uncharacterized protein M421DRAFT_118172 [Didymella exigua CBS 183.55]KAF1934314.1 hypothetical protein M421DRAFT_118172 [Didymella exigua CBS 183.55]